jgi:pimeloyl-ACP methyl ester carboxylesterase
MGEPQAITSADGTTIALERDGTAGDLPALVIVTGAFNDRCSSVGLADVLRGRFTAYRFDRRGRGDSGDTPPWAVAREVEDLAAVLAVTGETPYVYGHSSGAALALEAAAAGVAMRRLLVYEPPYTGGLGARASDAEKLEALIAEGRLDDAAIAFLRGTGAPQGAIERVRASAAWPGMVALAPTLAYDVRLVNDGTVPTQRYSAIAIPVLAVAGGLSPDWARQAAEEVAAAVSEGEARLVEGQNHQIALAALLPLLDEFFA